MNTAELAAGSAETIRERGWCKHALGNDDGHVCFVGAAFTVLTGNHMGSRQRNQTRDDIEELCTQADKVICNEWGNEHHILPEYDPGADNRDYVVAWNNADDRTIDDVLLVLDKVANQ